MTTTKQTAPKHTRGRIIIFQESDGFHWNLKDEARKLGYLDARGKGYFSRKAAKMAALEAEGRVS